MFIKKIYNLFKKDLFLIPRSITGKGLRDTLKIFKKIFPRLKIKKIKSGKKVETKEASRTYGSGKSFGRGLPKPKAAPRHLKEEVIELRT